MVNIFEEEFYHKFVWKPFFWGIFHLFFQLLINSKWTFVLTPANKDCVCAFIKLHQKSFLFFFPVQCKSAGLNLFITEKKLQNRNWKNFPLDYKPIKRCLCVLPSWNYHGASHSNECIVVEKKFDVITWTSYIIIINFACYKQLLFGILRFVHLPFQFIIIQRMRFLPFLLFSFFLFLLILLSHIFIENNFQKIPQRWNIRRFWHFLVDHFY